MCFVWRLAMETVDRFSDTLDLTEHASRIIHPLVRTLDNTPELRKTAMDTLTSVAQQLHRRYLIFSPMVSRVCSKHRIQHQRYDLLMSRLSKVCKRGTCAGSGVVRIASAGSRIVRIDPLRFLAGCCTR